MTDPTDPEERAALAAELALGLLDGTEHAAALRLTLSDANFAAEVEDWRTRLAPMLDDIGSHAPPAHLWPVIEARIAAGAQDSVVRSLRLWRSMAIASTAIAASLALFLVLTPAQQPSSPVAIAQLSDAGGAAQMAIAYDGTAGTLRLARVTLDAGGKSPELWVIPAGGPPQSLGLIRPDSGTLAVPETLRGLMRDGATLAITMEDGASAPHAAPSGPPVLSGKISAI
jgi:anti-sigma-K factor RskA